MAWVRLDDSFAQHPKVLSAGPLAMALQVAALCYCNRNLTDGFVPWSVARTLLSWEFLEGTRINHVAITSGASGEDVSSEYVIGLMIEAGMWEEVQGGYRVHDYEDYQPTKAQVEREKALKQAAGQAGGKAAAITRARAGAKASGVAKSKPVPDPVPVPDPDTETDPLAAEAAEEDDPLLAVIAKAYTEEIGSTISPSIHSEMLDWALRIPTREDALYPFQEAARNNKRSWAYCATIWTRLEADGWPADRETARQAADAGVIVMQDDELERRRKLHEAKAETA